MVTYSPAAREILDRIEKNPVNRRRLQRYRLAFALGRYIRNEVESKRCNVEKLTKASQWRIKQVIEHPTAIGPLDELVSVALEIRGANAAR